LAILILFLALFLSFFSYLFGYFGLFWAILGSILPARSPLFSFPLKNFDSPDPWSNRETFGTP
jgi:hypothetical protein